VFGKQMIAHTKFPIVTKLRWVMLSAIAFSMLLTLCGQPGDFWHDSTKAMRGDGLSIYASTNHTFDFLLGYGALPFLAANLVYMTVAFFAVSRLPRAIALISIFAAIFAHGYGATNWLVVRFHFGIGPGVVTCGTLLGVLLSFAVLPTWNRSREAVNVWRWLMVAVLFVDFANTLIGQPASYWQDPTTMHEGNALTRMFLGRGWIYYLGLDLILAAGQFVLIKVLPLPVAFVCVFAFIFASFVGASNWFFYVWRLGWIAPVAYGTVLSALMVQLAFRNRNINEPNKALEPTAVGHSL
jgi:hypothetical protein